MTLSWSFKKFCFCIAWNKLLKFFNPQRERFNENYLKSRNRSDQIAAQVSSTHERQLRKSLNPILKKKILSGALSQSNKNIKAGLVSSFGAFSKENPFYSWTKFYSTLFFSISRLFNYVHDENVFMNFQLLWLLANEGEKKGLRLNEKGYIRS